MVKLHILPQRRGFVFPIKQLIHHDRFIAGTLQVGFLSSFGLLNCGPPRLWTRWGGLLAVLLFPLFFAPLPELISNHPWFLHIFFSQYFRL